MTDARTSDTWTIAALEPGDSKTYTTTTTVTEEDILSGHVLNDATAKGTSPDPNESEVPVDPGHADDKAEKPDGHLTVTKTTTSETKTEGYKLGDEVSYEIVVTNDGNLTITDIEVTDERTSDTWTIAALEPDDSKTYTAKTTVTEADILSGHILNEATAKGISPDPNEPAVPVTPGNTDDKPEMKNGHLTVTKKTTISEPKNGFKLGDEVSYKIVVTNDGNLTIENVEVTDDRTSDTWTVGTLEPGDSKTYTTKTTVNEADILNGHILNEATAKGNSPDPNKPDVPVTPGKTDDNPEVPNGHLTVTKTTTSSTPTNGYKLGDEVSYKIVVTNDGNLTIENVKVMDDRTGDTWTVGTHPE